MVPDGLHIDTDGSKFWYKDSWYHREDGPSCEYSDGSKEWYVNGKQIGCNSQEEFIGLMKLKVFW